MARNSTAGTPTVWGFVGLWHHFWEIPALCQSLGIGGYDILSKKVPLIQWWYSFGMVRAKTFSFDKRSRQREATEVLRPPLYPLGRMGLTLFLVEFCPPFDQNELSFK
ncbi:MAG: hypothetical protein F6J98_05525 [Moorea sp. SIO4G2]|nr:hypothetical protein [Moorena sp. SIO4G2]